jgi:hypothetical protein
MIVQIARRLRIEKGLALHDMTPVTGGETTGNKHGPVQPARQSKGFVAPGMPVDRVVQMAEQIRTKLSF